MFFFLSYIFFLQQNQRTREQNLLREQEAGEGGKGEEKGEVEANNVYTCK
jgi:hypothetical protein